MSKYEPGQSGNPNGRPIGALNRRTQLAKLLEPHAEELITTLIMQAKQGEPNALRLCIERLIPKLKNEAPTISLPSVDTTLPGSLKLFRRALLNTLAEQEEINMDSLKLVLELCVLCKKEEQEVMDDDESTARLAEIVKRLHKETI